MIRQIHLSIHTFSIYDSPQQCQWNYGSETVIGKYLLNKSMLYLSTYPYYIYYLSAPTVGLKISLVIDFWNHEIKPNGDNFEVASWNRIKTNARPHRPEENMTMINDFNWHFAEAAVAFSMAPVSSYCFYLSSSPIYRQFSFLSKCGPFLSS